MYYLYYIYLMLLLHSTLSDTSIQCMMIYTMNDADTTVTENIFNARLRHAIIKDNLEQAKQALREGTDIHDSSLLHDALFTRSKKMVKLLLDHSAPPNTFHPTITIPGIYTVFATIGIAIPIYEGSGNTLSIALFLRDASLVHLLLRYGATIHQEEYPNQSQERDLAKASVKPLGAEGLFLSALIDDDPTCLQELFMQTAADTALQTHPHSKLKRLKNLFKKPEKPYTLNTPNCYGKTPLMLAAVAGKEHITRFLLHARANAELKDEQGNTAYTLARQQDNIRIAKLIESYVLFYKKLILAHYIAKHNQFGLTQDIATIIADYAITLD